MAKAESDLKAILDGGFDPHQFLWYEPDLTEAPEPAKTLLERYSNIPPDQVVDHVKKVVSCILRLESIATNQYRETEHFSWYVETKDPKQFPFSLCMILERLLTQISFRTRVSEPFDSWI